MAAKELRRLNEQHEALTNKENKSIVFTAAIQEELEDARPAYDFAEMQRELNEIEETIRRIKHSINAFNLTQEVPGFDMTIDQMLVYIPQLTARKKKFDYMRRRLPKERCDKSGYSRSTSIVEYEYSNFDIKQAEEEYTLVAEELAKAQNALDKVNSTVKFDVGI